MCNRWAILVVLFVGRAAMAFQFQSVACAAPLLGRNFDASLADIGLLIGVYFAPGAALAWPGGAIGRRLGDKQTVLIGLLMMVGGEVWMATSVAWSLQVAGRLVAGTGGVLVNVLMTKMIVDWFTGREIATAMAVFVNSWPVGVAMSLMLLPMVGATYGLLAVDLTVAGLAAVGAFLFALAYRAPDAPVAGDVRRISPDAEGVRAVLTVGLIWCLYNVGLAMVFSFGPTMLVARGWSATEAGSTMSIVLWLAALSVPIGGLLADRVRCAGAVLVSGCVAFALLTLAFPRTSLVLPVVVALGFVCGLPAGPIMSLPARVLDQGTRPVGMGLFYTIYYAGMLVAPVVGGRLSNMRGTASAALDFGALALLLCPALFWLFRVFSASLGPPPVHGRLH